MPNNLSSAEAFVAEARKLELAQPDFVHGVRRAARNHEAAADAIIAGAQRAGRENLLAREQEQVDWHSRQAEELHRHDPGHGIDYSRSAGPTRRRRPQCSAVR
jgi:hypothetical protein